jgi:hypothetical protein
MAAYNTSELIIRKEKMLEPVKPGAKPPAVPAAPSSGH